MFKIIISQKVYTNNIILSSLQVKSYKLLI